MILPSLTKLKMNNFLIQIDEINFPILAQFRKVNLVNLGYMQSSMFIFAFLSTVDLNLMFTELLI